MHSYLAQLVVHDMIDTSIYRRTAIAIWNGYIGIGLQLLFQIIIFENTENIKYKNEKKNPGCLAQGPSPSFRCRQPSSAHKTVCCLLPKFPLTINNQ